jgi:hypothetical protein
MEVMNLENRKINLINWISSIQEPSIIDKMEAIQKENAEWWDSVSDEDKQAIEEGLDQLDKGEYLTRSHFRSKVKEKYNF